MFTPTPSFPKILTRASLLPLRPKSTLPFAFTVIRVVLSVIICKSSVVQLPSLVTSDSTSITNSDCKLVILILPLGASVPKPNR